MIFVADYAEKKAQKSEAFYLLTDGVRVRELEHQMPPLEWEYRPGSGAMPVAAETLLSPENTIAEGERSYDDDPNVSVLWLKSVGDLPDKIFLKNDVYGVTVNDEIDSTHLGEKLASFENPPLGVLRHIGALNHQYFLLIGDHRESPHADAQLWLINHTTHEQTKLTDDPYYSFSRPPNVFKPEGLNGEVLVYYVGSIAYGFGGDCCRPQYSVVRLFSSTRPQGIDLIKFAFKAGTIVEVDFKDGALVLTGDPSRPRTDEDRLPPRLWQVNLPSGLAPIIDLDK